MKLFLAPLRKGGDAVALWNEEVRMETIQQYTRCGGYKNLHIGFHRRVFLVSALLIILYFNASCHSTWLVEIFIKDLRMIIVSQSDLHRANPDHNALEATRLQSCFNDYLDGLFLFFIICAGFSDNSTSSSVI